MTEQPAALRRRRPTIVVNPSDDPVFAARIEQGLASTGRQPALLESALRSTYPNAVVRRREISGEPLEVWYVYRDGRWVAKGADVRG
jgi:hypothetical protein